MVAYWTRTRLLHPCFPAGLRVTSLQCIVGKGGCRTRWKRGRGCHRAEPVSDPGARAGGGGATRARPGRGLFRTYGDRFGALLGAVWGRGERSCRGSHPV